MVTTMALQQEEDGPDVLSDEEVSSFLWNI